MANLPDRREIYTRTLIRQASKLTPLRIFSTEPPPKFDPPIFSTPTRRLGVCNCRLSQGGWVSAIVAIVVIHPDSLTTLNQKTKFVPRPEPATGHIDRSTSEYTQRQQRNASRIY